MFGDSTPFTAGFDAKAPDTVPVVKTVTIRDMKFEPSKIRIHKGEIIEWIIASGDAEECTKHVIGFDDDNYDIESQPLKQNGDKFKCRFFECGSYNYRCQIYSTRLKGIVEVVSENDVMGRYVSKGNINNINKIFGKANVRDIYQSSHISNES